MVRRRSWRVSSPCNRSCRERRDLYFGEERKASFNCGCVCLVKATPGSSRDTPFRALIEHPPVMTTRWRSLITQEICANSLQSRLQKKRCPTSAPVSSPRKSQPVTVSESWTESIEVLLSRCCHNGTRPMRSYKQHKKERGVRVLDRLLILMK
jgi:hypothetical protein